MFATVAANLFLRGMDFFVDEIVPSPSFLEAIESGLFSLAKAVKVFFR